MAIDGCEVSSTSDRATLFSGIYSQGSCQRHLILDTDLLWLLPVTAHISLCIWHGNKCAAAQSILLLGGDGAYPYNYKYKI